MTKPWVLKWSAGGRESTTYDAVGVHDAGEHAQAWAEAATGNVAMVRIGFSGGDTLYVVPAVGQKCAIGVGSDRYQYEVCEVRPNGKTIFIKRGEDILQARKQLDGFYKLWGAGHKSGVIFTNTEDYRDPHI